MRRRVVEFWTSSKLYVAIDGIISKYYRSKLHNDNFSILCPNCIGGAIYHRFGKRFLSPTINMWMSQPNFVKFLLNLDGYLSEELRFRSRVKDYPVAIIGDGIDLPEIELNFNHAASSTDAKNDWERRKTRINKDNLYIILYNLDGITRSEIELLNDYPCNNKAILTATPLEWCEWSYYIRPNMHREFPYNYVGRNILGIRDYEKSFNITGFLNKK